MGLPIVYRRNTEQDLVNFDFTNFATGTGFVTLYAGEIFSGAIGLLSPNTFYSYRALSCSASTSTNGSASQFGHLLFDLPVEKPFRVEGDCVVQIPLGCAPGAVASFNVSAEVTIIQVFEDGTSSALSTTSGAILRQQSSNNTFTGTIPHLLPLPRTLFKPGESLRLMIKAYGWCDTSNGARFLIGFDPEGRITSEGFEEAAATFLSGDNTKLKVSLPFKVDI